MVARGLYSYPKNGSLWLKEGCCMGLQKIFQGQVKVFPESTRYNWPESIEKSNISYQVWSHEGSTFKKKCHILSKIPVLGNLTHMWHDQSDFLPVHCTYSRSCRYIVTQHCPKLPKTCGPLVLSWLQKNIWQFKMKLWLKLGRPYLHIVYVQILA